MVICLLPVKCASFEITKLMLIKFINSNFQKINILLKFNFDVYRSVITLTLHKTEAVFYKISQQELIILQKSGT